MQGKKKLVRKVDTDPISTSANKVRRTARTEKKRGEKTKG